MLENGVMKIMKLNVSNCVVGCGILQTRVKHNFARLSSEWLRLGVSKQTQGPERNCDVFTLVCISWMRTSLQEPVPYWDIFKDFNSPNQILVLSCYKSLWCSLFYRTNPVSGHPTGSTTSTELQRVLISFSDELASRLAWNHYITPVGKSASFWHFISTTKASENWLCYAFQDYEWTSELVNVELYKEN